MRRTRPEKTHWRDASLSLRHRAWGNACPAVDLDFTLLEYDDAKPAALIEFKRHGAAVDLRGPSLRALAALADAAAIPFLLVKYWPDTWAFDITPMNEPGRRTFRSGLHTELQFVTALHSLRGRPVPTDVLPWLRCELPPV